MSNKKPLAFRFIRRTIDIFYPTFEMIGLDKIPEKNAVIVGNHAQMNGPLISELRIPCEPITWCAAQMMDREDVAEYAFTDFWSQKPRAAHPFYRLLSRMIVPLSVLLFNNARTIPVYRDTRSITTFRRSVDALAEGHNITIFPECDKPYNNIIYDFQRKYVDLGKLYYRREKEDIAFVPMYIAPRLRKVFFGDPITFDHDAPIEQERERICGYLMDEITSIAQAQPLHTVVPYRNIKKSLYPVNKPQEGGDRI